MWPQAVVDRFNVVSPPYNRDYGGYNKLLSCLFKLENDFVVDPQPRERKTTAGLDRFVTLTVLFGERELPVFFVIVEAKEGISSVSTCTTADEQVRQHMRDSISELYSNYEIFNDHVNMLSHS